MLNELLKVETTKRAINIGESMLVSACDKFLKGKLLYSVNLRGIRFRINLSIAKFFDIEKAANDDPDGNVSIVLDTYNSCTNSVPPSSIWWRGTPIVLHHKSGIKPIYRGSENPQVSGGLATKDMYLSTIRSDKNVHNLKAFLTMLIKMGDKLNLEYYHGKSQLFNATNNGYMLDLPRRTFDDVFLRKKDKDIIINSIDHFIKSRKWYEKNNIPYHYGILLHGVPGSGKSSIAQAIANYIDAYLVVVPGDLMMGIPEMIANGNIPRTPGYVNIILVEDCDCGIKSSGFRPLITSDEIDNEEENKRPKGMAHLLNTLDGFGAPTNTIYIFTTNHIEKLDPALIRPGRIDLKVEVGPVCYETFDQFCLKHFGQVSNEDFAIPDGTTFAELQTEIMRGKDLPGLIKYLRSKEEKN